MGLAILVFINGLIAGMFWSETKTSNQKQQLLFGWILTGIPIYFIAKYLSAHDNDYYRAIIIGILFSMSFCVGYGADDIGQFNEKNPNKASILRLKSFWGKIVRLCEINFIIYIIALVIYFKGAVFGGKIEGENYFLYGVQKGQFEVEKNVYEINKIWSYLTIWFGILMLVGVNIRNKASWILYQDEQGKEKDT